MTENLIPTDMGGSYCCHRFPWAQGSVAVVPGMPIEGVLNSALREKKDCKDMGGSTCNPEECRVAELIRILEKLQKEN